ncbi:uncharacterized protein KD926_006857 [Aspergillus affinis]|uniref:uncharacterized protein n=1 Tax=Aspergillus affinis TaxID=1070780 RepID=UPI0022FDD896|nr:uncharacterized protein KD926_006857 [Aspergillus affinis]KAI9041461.1 hypothetical protein KD926_006857 [Aspergillus affinis]
MPQWTLLSIHAHQAYTRYPPINLIYAPIMKSIMNYSIPGKLQTRRIFGFSGAQDTEACTLTRNAISEASIAVSCAFIDNCLSGEYALPHTTDLVRFPLLLKYGGVYADVGLIQIGDLDRMWIETVANPASPVEALSLLLKLWEERTSIEGMSKSPLLKGVPFMNPSASFEEDGKTFSPGEVSTLLTDFIIQGQVMSLVMGLVDEEEKWNGPEYVARHIFGIDYMVGSQLINDLTAWNGTKAFELMSLRLPQEGETESEDQRFAREIVEALFGNTLGSLWRQHDGSNNAPHTYAHWLRYGVVHWNQDELPSAKDFVVPEPYKRGPLLRDE